MKILRKVLAFFLSLIFISTAFTGSISLALIRTYLNPDFYQSTEFEDLLYGVIVEKISDQLEKKEEKISTLLTHDEIEKSVKTVITPEIMQNTISDVLSQLKQIPLPDEIIIDTEPLKKNLPFVIDEISQKIQPTDTSLPDNLKQSFQQEVTDYIPPRLSLPLTDLPPEIRRAITLFVLGTSHAIESIISILIILLIGIGMLIGKPLQKALRWIASPLISSGVILLGFINFFKIIILNVNSLAILVGEPVLNYLKFYSWIFIIFGLTLFVGSFVIKQTNNQITCPTSTLKT